MSTYRRYRKRKLNKAKLFKNLLFMFILISVVFISGRYIIKITYAVLTSTEEMNKAEDILILVNKEHDIPEKYVPGNLVEADVQFPTTTAMDQKMMQKDAAKALEKLFKSAEKESINLFGVSGYRSFDYQKKIYDKKVKAVGREEAGKYVAYPGQSEHQTGLAMDVTNKAGASNILTENFGKTKEGQWLKDNAHYFGFIIRYPKGKEDITGYNYEPWHLRYVGIEAATEIKSRGIVLEEYLQNNDSTEDAENAGAAGD